MPPSALLTVRPRDCEESELMLARDPSTLRWSVVGQDERAQLSDGRQRILAWLEAHADGGSPTTITTELGMNADSGRQFLTQVASASQISKPKRGWYTATPKPSS